MRILIIVFLIFILSLFINGAITKDNETMVLKYKIVQLQNQKDSVIYFYEDISNCIKKDFNIDNNGKIKFKPQKK